MSGFDVGIREQEKTWKIAVLRAMVVYAVLVSVFYAFFSVFQVGVKVGEAAFVLGVTTVLPLLLLWKNNHRMKKIGYSFLGLAVISILLYKKVYAGIAPYVNRYVELYNDYYLSEIPVMTVETDEFSKLFILFLIGMIFSMILFIVLETKRGLIASVFVILIPVILSAIIGEMPVTWSCFAMILSGCFYVILFHHSDDTLPMKELAIVLCLVSILFGVSKWFQPVIADYKNENIDKYEEIRRKISSSQMVSLEQFDETVTKIKTSKSSYGGGGVSKGNLRNLDSFNPTGEVAMEIILEEKPSQTIYLKAFVGSKYTGESWDEIGTFAFADMISPIGGASKKRTLMNEPFERVNETDLGFSLQTMKITLENASREFGYSPYYAEIPNKYDVHLDSYVEGSWSKTREYRFYPDVPYGFLYGVVYDATAGHLSELLNEPSKLWEEYQQFVKEAYVGEYPELERLNAYCEDWDMLDGSSIDEILSHLLRAEYIYSREPGEMPSDMDLAEGFFFEKKEGFCVHFATVATLIYQICGEPARYVEGYAVSVNQFKKQEDGTYRAVVTDEDAHAWCEVFCEDVGWQPREYTPNSITSTQRPDDSIHHLETNTEKEDEQEEDSQSDSQSDSTSEDSQDDSQSDDENQEKPQEDNSVDNSENGNLQGGNGSEDSQGENKIFANKIVKEILTKCGIAAGIIFTLFFTVLLQQRIRRRGKVRSFRKKKQNKGILNIYNEIYQLCVFAGLEVSKESEKENVKKMAEKFTVVSEEEWNWIYDLAEKARFSGKQYSAVEQKELYRLYQRLRKDVLKSLKWNRKLWFLYVRAM